MAIFCQPEKQQRNDTTIQNCLGSTEMAEGNGTAVNLEGINLCITGSRYCIPTALCITNLWVGQRVRQTQGKYWERVIKNWIPELNLWLTGQQAALRWSSHKSFLPHCKGSHFDFACSLYEVKHCYIFNVMARIKTGTWILSLFMSTHSLKASRSQNILINCILDKRFLSDNQ